MIQARDSQMTGSDRVKHGMAEMSTDGVMALERIPAEIHVEGGVSRASDLDVIDGTVATISSPVMAKACIGD